MTTNTDDTVFYVYFTRNEIDSAKSQNEMLPIVCSKTLSWKETYRLSLTRTECLLFEGILCGKYVSLDESRLNEVEPFENTQRVKRAKNIKVVAIFSTLFLIGAIPVIIYGYHGSDQLKSIFHETGSDFFKQLGFSALGVFGFFLLVAIYQLQKEDKHHQNKDTFSSGLNNPTVSQETPRCNNSHM